MFVLTPSWNDVEFGDGDYYRSVSFNWLWNLVACVLEVVVQLGLASEKQVSMEIDPALGRLGRGGVLIPN